MNLYIITIETSIFKISPMLIWFKDNNIVYECKKDNLGLGYFNYYLKNKSDVMLFKLVWSEYIKNIRIKETI